MENISIAVLCSLVSIVISYLTFTRNSTKDVRSEAAQSVELKSRLEYISRGIDDIKLENRIRDDQIKTLNEKVIILDNTVTTIVKRMDRIDNLS